MSSSILALAAAAAAQAVAPQTTAQEAPTAQAPLALTCEGAGAATKHSRGSVNGDGWSASIMTQHDREFSDQVDVRLFSGDDRIRMPRTMLPVIHGGADGWFVLKNVVADARSIHASAAVGLLNNPKVYIDRVTGMISISGKAGDYAGQCQAMQADAPAKF